MFHLVETGLDSITKARAEPEVTADGLDFPLPWIGMAEVSGAVLDERQAVAEFASEIRTRLGWAHEFWFAGLEVTARGGIPQYPEVAVDGRSVFDAGRAWSPFEMCWFEWKTVGAREVGLAVERLAGSIRVTKFEGRDRDNGTYRPLSIGCFSVELVPASLVPTGEKSACPGLWPHTRIVDPFGHFERVRKAEIAAEDADAETVLPRMLEPYTFAAYLIMILASNRKTIERQRTYIENRRPRPADGSWPPDRNWVRLKAGWSPSLSESQ